MSMSNWKNKIFKKKAAFSRGQTHGRTKGVTCNADWKKRYYMCNPKAVKDREYSHYHQMAINLNRG